MRLPTSESFEAFDGTASHEFPVHTIVEVACDETEGYRGVTEGFACGVEGWKPESRYPCGESLKFVGFRYHP